MAAGITAQPTVGIREDAVPSALPLAMEPRKRLPIGSLVDDGTLADWAPLSVRGSCGTSHPGGVPWSGSG